MRIIICDDDPIFLDEMSGRIYAYFEKQSSNVTIKTVLDGKELLRMLGKQMLYFSTLICRESMGLRLPAL